MNKYELHDESGDLVRIFISHEEAVKHLTSGDYLVITKTAPKPKVSVYDYAMKKVGECLI